MRLKHVSDTHGKFSELNGSFDLVVHTGDLLPNSHHYLMGDRIGEIKFQLRWVHDHLEDIKKWLMDRPFLFVLGNHDFLHPEELEYELSSSGIKCYNLTDKVTSVDNLNFYGFPYVPTINGAYNYEKNIPEMQVEVDKMVEQLNSTYVDIIAAHSPMYQTLDSFRGEKIGSSVMSNAFDYKINKDMIPFAYLHGHVHSANGIATRNGVLVSNAATVQHIIEC